jgi:hypothetical protein
VFHDFGRAIIIAIITARNAAILPAGFAVLAMTTGRNCERYRAAAQNLSSGEQIIIIAAQRHAPPSR